MSLRYRIIIGYTIIVIGVISLISYLILSDMRPRYLEAVEESTVDTAELLAAVIANQSANGRVRYDNLAQIMRKISERRLTAQIYGFEKQRVRLIVYVTDENGILLYDSTGESSPGENFIKWKDVFLTIRGQYGARSTKILPGDPASSTIFVAAPIERDGKLIGVVSVGKPKSSVALFIDIAKKKLIYALLLVGASAIVLSFYLSRRITRPIQRLTEYVRSIQQGASDRLPPLGASEIRMLGEALEDMRSQLEGKNYIEDYIRTLTHEMKNPLTAIRGASEILRDDCLPPDKKELFIGNIEAEVIRLQKLVERMLQLARLENVRTVNKENIRLAGMLKEVTEALNVQLAQKNINVVIEAEPTIAVQGDAFLMHQALVNLVQNSIEFSREGSTIEIAATAGRHEISIIVRDFGSGMPEFAIPRAFEKFFSLERPETGKKSTGLGLAFVKEVVALHGGAIKIENSNPGLKVTINLPST